MFVQSCGSSQAPASCYQDRIAFPEKGIDISEGLTASKYEEFVP